ncbi:unnamed protein product [Parnassius apollo]|uniref:(apollo) hypothetical protein n=1 Tax=Parnassius apollo TaxID=110799 RepID=A0A8S3Y9C6_PARAO|nr:unnamed protein product [Parnassius apollo]
MKRNDVILRLALKDKRNISADYYQKIEGTNMQDITISNSATYNTEVILSTSSIEVKDQSSKQIENPIDDTSTDSSSDSERHRSIKISDDSETEDNVGNQANFKATPAATSSVSTLYSSLDDTIPDTKKRSRKRVAKPTEWLQNKCKILRNAGSAYVTLKTKVKKDARKIKPPCSERCRLKCKEEFSEIDREAVFKEFWELKNINRQRHFINRHMAPIKRKYRYTTTQKGRQLNHAFYLTKMGCQIQICKTFFMNTIDINNRVIQTVIKKRTFAGSVEEDKRGKHHSHHKLPIADCVKESIRNHVNSIPRIESYYWRQQTAREFIEGRKTIADLHCEDVKECGLNNRPHSNYVKRIGSAVAKSLLHCWLRLRHCIALGLDPNE